MGFWEEPASPPGSTPFGARANRRAMGGSDDEMRDAVADEGAKAQAEDCLVVKVPESFCACHGERPAGLPSGPDGGRIIVGGSSTHPHHTANRFTAAVDCCLQHFAFWREPEPVIDKLGVARHQLVLLMRRTPVQRDGFHRATCGQQNGAARGFIDAA